MHFELGSAALSQSARDILSWMGASELAFLSNPASEMILVGTADRVDTEWYNLALSSARAKNGLQALQNSVGPQLKCATKTVGLGESVAAALGHPDKVANPEHRRVFVDLNGSVVVTLRGSKSKGAKGT